jgi:integrase
MKGVEMAKFNAKNERIKREYFRFQTEAKQKSQSTLRGIRKAIHRFETYTKFKDFGTFNKEQAIGFKKHLAQSKGRRSGETLSKSTILQTVNALKEFFQWASWQPGYKSKIHPPEIEYLNLSEKDVRVAKTAKIKKFPSVEQIRKVVEIMPVGTVIERRDRALIAFTILSGMRDSAVASLMLKHLDLDSNPPVVRQESDKVNTKFSKQIITHFFPVGENLEKVVRDWVRELKDTHGFAETDPLFPKTKVSHDANASFVVDGVGREFWSTATPIRQIFKKSFEGAGLEYYNPHSFRNTLVHLGQKLCKTPEQFKAWSQSLGHESPLTTFTSYGELDSHQQGQVFLTIGKNQVVDPQSLLDSISQLVNGRETKAP